MKYLPQPFGTSPAFVLCKQCILELHFDYFFVNEKFSLKIQFLMIHKNTMSFFSRIYLIFIRLSPASESKSNAFKLVIECQINVSWSMKLSFIFICVMKDKVVAFRTEWN